MEDPLILGIDEAGKGPVLGDLIIAGAMYKKSRKKDLKILGVKDSKMLTVKKREELFSEVKKLAEKYEVITVSPNEIDQRYNVGTNMNKIEAVKFAELINRLKPDIAVIDCPSANTKGFQDYMSQFLTHKCRVKCENYADKNHIEVGAASIIAKVTRDAGIKEIEKEIGMPVGAGYPSDPVTIKFIEKVFKNKEFINKYIRKTWFTFQNIINKKEQKKLGEY
jgi:ribonuclease HII